MKATRARVRKFLNEVKNKPCADCGNSYPSFVMQFDHVREKKKFNLAHAVNCVYTVNGVRAEVAKCDVVCANCHMIRTHG